MHSWCKSRHKKELPQRTYGSVKLFVRDVRLFVKVGRQ